MIYKGKISFDEYGFLLCGSQCLISHIEDDFKKGDNVFIRYYISDNEITVEQGNTALIINTCCGYIEELDFELDADDEYTVLDYNEAFKVGGHDIFDEIECYEGKYLILIIEKK